MLRNYLTIGKIVSTHGVKGEIRLDPWCDNPAFLKNFKTLYFDNEGREKVAVQSARPHGNIAILKLENVDSIEQAQALRNKLLYIDRKDAKLPENAWFIEDLIGCTVKENGTDRVYGTLTDIQQLPANDVWTIKDSNGKETLIPAIKSVVIKTDVQNGIIEIKALKGLFDDIESVVEDED